MRCRKIALKLMLFVDTTRPKINIIFIFIFINIGNSPTQLEKKIRELHNQAWTSRLIQYMTDCKFFSGASRAGLITPQRFDEPPQQMAVPTYQWFIAVYCQEVKSRVDEVKAAITSVFGNVLKMDSTKKVSIQQLMT